MTGRRCGHTNAVVGTGAAQGRPPAAGAGDRLAGDPPGAADMDQPEEAPGSSTIGIGRASAGGASTGWTGRAVSKPGRARLLRSRLLVSGCAAGAGKCRPPGRGCPADGTWASRPPRSPARRRAALRDSGRERLGGDAVGPRLDCRPVPVVAVAATHGPEEGAPGCRPVGPGDRPGEVAVLARAYVCPEAGDFRRLLAQRAQPHRHPRPEHALLVTERAD